jgi:exodeoxyribonuclease VII small subunit
MMTKKKPLTLSFEAELKALETAVERLEQGDLPLEEALACFEGGVQAASRCQGLLKDVETRVECLLKDRAGELHLEAFTTDEGD